MSATPVSHLLYVMFSDHHRDSWWFLVCLCKEWVVYLSTSGSMLLMLLIAVDRAYAVTYPIEHMQYSSSTVTLKKALIILWATSFCFPGIVVFDAASSFYLESKKVTDICFVVHYAQSAMIVFVCCVIAIILILTSACYFQIYRVLKKRRNSLFRIHEAHPRHLESRVTRTIQTLLGVYFVCIMPHMLATFLWTVLPVNIGDGLLLFTNTLFCLGWNAHPFVYVFHNAEVKKAYQAAFCCCCRWCRNRSWAVER